MNVTSDRQAASKPKGPWANLADVPGSVRAILRQMRIDRLPRDQQRKHVARAAGRGQLLPAELDELRDAGWLED